MDYAGEFLLKAPQVAATMKLDIPDARDEAVEQKSGRYKLLEQIGEGGCGVVYMADWCAACKSTNSVIAGFSKGGWNSSSVSAMQHVLKKEHFFVTSIGD